MTPLVIVGAGDHGRVMLDVARTLPRDVLAFVDPDRSSTRGGPAAVDGLLVLGPIEQAVGELPAHVEFVVAIGDCGARERIFDRCQALGLRPTSLVHPSALLLGGATVGWGAQVCANAVIGVAAAVGADVIVNTAATLDHDVRVEDHAFVGPGAHLAGRVHVGRGAHIGVGAVIREGCTIGDRALVAAGAVVVRDVAPGVRVAGVPARPMNTSGPSESMA